MSIEKKTIRSDIPGHHNYLNTYPGGTNEEASRLIVGRDIGLSGEIVACDHLVVEGVVQAATFTARRMDILESGLFAGQAEVQDAVIAGRFEGNLAVLGRLTVKSTGRIYGEVSYVTLEAESGAKIEGQMTVMTVAVAEGTLAPVQVNDNDEEAATVSGDGDGEESVSKTVDPFRRAVGF